MKSHGCKRSPIRRERERPSASARRWDDKLGQQQAGGDFPHDGAGQGEQRRAADIAATAQPRGEPISSSTERHARHNAFAAEEAALLVGPRLVEHHELPRSEGKFTGSRVYREGTTARAGDPDDAFEHGDLRERGIDRQPLRYAQEAKL